MGFVEEFKKKGSELIQKAVDKRFRVPHYHKDVNRKQLFLKEKQNINTTFNGIQVSVSRKESECLRLAASGLTMKGIAYELNISPRTVETYLNRLKVKTGLFTKQDLAKFYHSKLQIFSCTSIRSNTTDRKALP